MLQLIKKDFMIHKNLIMAMFVVLLFYMYIDISHILLGLLFTWTMTLHILYTDEKRKAQILLSSLPFTRKEIVSSKYISALLFVVLIILTMIAGNLIIHQQLPNGLHLILVFIASLFIVAFNYLFSYKFASKYLLFAFFVCFGCYFLVIRLFLHNLNDQIYEIFTKIMTFSEPKYIVYAVVLLVIMYSLSWLLSIKIYEKKVF